MLSLTVSEEQGTSFGERIELVRLKCRVPKAVMASLFGVNPATYWRWVKGQSRPRQSKLQLVKLVVRALMAAYNKGELPLIRHGKSAKTVRAELLAMVYRYRS
jgi:hypothetical protein